MHTILVVEDEPSIAAMLTMALQTGGYAVRVATDGEAALREVGASRPDVILLDVGLPLLDGIEVCRRLRAAGDWTPIIFVTARDDEVDRVVGIELGADDYVTKPFSPREVVARIGAVLRRTRAGHGVPDGDGSLAIGVVRLDPGQRRVTVDGVEVGFTVTEFDLLAWLMRRPGHVFTREHLMESVWGYAAASGHRTVDVHIAQIRAKLGGHDVIRTVRGVGYSARRDHG